jgi:hypothetical protein|tara:strand:+ start:1884 stop:4286 length:2403 start_codon:yes stop_codon:yes gene_type:complete
MSIEKPLEPLVPAEMEIEIEIDPEEGEVEVEIEVKESTFEENLAEELEFGVQESLSDDVLENIKIDLDSRKDWEKTYAQGIKLLGLKIEERTEPWDGACGVFHPVLSEAVVRFQSETILSTFPASGPVKTQIVGAVDVKKQESANRVQESMNYELTENMPEYRSEHERLLWSLPITGSAFKKVYFDPSLNRQVAMFVPAEDIIVPFGASDLQSAPRITHRLRKTENEIRKLMSLGFYMDIELPDADPVKTEVETRKNEESGYSAVKDERYTIYECHCEIDLVGHEDKKDGEITEIALPYVVTMLSTGEVLSIRRNYLEDDPTKLKRMHFVHYPYIPGFGFYGFGLIHLVGGFAESATSILRQLVDAGTLSNLPGGFKSKDLRVKGDDTPIAPGEFRDVDVTGMTIKESIVPLPYKEPSATLYQLLNTIIEEGRRFASVADLKVADMSGQTPVGTTLAILERTLKVMTAVQARVHVAMRQEFKLLSKIIRDYTPPIYKYDVQGSRFAKMSDYDSVDVIPVSDPNASTMAQKVVQYQAALQLAQGAPDIYNLPLLHRQMLEVLGIKDVQKIVPLEEDFKPTNPIEENMNILKSKPVKAFLYQDHEAHITAHMNMANDPKIKEIVGQSPNANAIQAALQAHVAEHVAFQYRIEIEKMLGVPLPPEEERLPDDVEVELSRSVAMASDKLLQKDTAEAQQKQAQEQSQDPIIQMQKAELELKQAKFAHDKAMDEAELQLKSKEATAKDQRENKRIDSQSEIAGAKIALDSVEEAQKLQEKKEEREKQDFMEGVNIAERAIDKTNQ